MLTLIRRLISFTLAGILLASLAACTGMMKSDKDKAAMEKKAMAEKAMAEKSLYERLGGQKAIVAVVDDFVGNVAADNRISGFFAGTDIPNFKRLLVEQICAGTGGPCTYTGRDMKTTHAGMGVNDAHFNALVEDLVKTLNKFNVPQQEQNELLAVLGPMKADIVTQ